MRQSFTEKIIPSPHTLADSCNVHNFDIDFN